MTVEAQPQDVLATEHLCTDLRGRAVRGGLLASSSQATGFVLTSIMTVVTARLLTPADFGLVAMAAAITGLGQAFADLGLSEATIQRQEISHEQVSALFWINVAIGIGLTLVMIGLAPVLAWFYREPRLKNLTFVLSLTFLIGGLRVQHNALLQRQMRFGATAIRDVAAYVVAVTVVIAMAWLGAGYWAIVSYPLAYNSTAVAFTWIMVPWLPGRPRCGTNVRSLVAFGGNVAGSYLINYLNRNTDNILVGWYWGASPLGLYSKAYSLLLRPVNQLNAPLSTILVPALSRLQDDPERLARYFLRVANLMMWIVTPLFGFLFVAAEPVIILVLGKKWLAAAPVFQFLCIAALAQLLYNPTMWLFVCRGQSGRMLKLLLILTPIFFVSYIVGLPFGIKGVALSGSLVFVGIFPWLLKYAFRGTSLTLRRLGQAIRYPISLCLAGVFSAELALRLIAPQRIVSQLLVVALGFAAAYSLSALIPAVREEALSLRGLLADVRLSRQAA
ncbi:MAG TPA: lipopolysaccharide biosynthesis protein [Terriglobales bacterium]|nr:lipopolysaccharide biosynthesis protein [Terriglobales bacterium]